jgi:hypothetical protein
LTCSDGVVSSVRRIVCALAFSHLVLLSPGLLAGRSLTSRALVWAGETDGRSCGGARAATGLHTFVVTAMNCLRLPLCSFVSLVAWSFSLSHFTASSLSTVVSDALSCFSASRLSVVLFSLALMRHLGAVSCLPPSLPTVVSRVSQAAGTPRLQTPIRISGRQSASRCRWLVFFVSLAYFPASLLTVFCLQVEALNKAIQESQSSQKLRHVMHISLLLGTDIRSVLLSCLL